VTTVKHKPQNAIQVMSTNQKVSLYDIFSVFITFRSTADTRSFVLSCGACQCHPHTELM